MTAVPLAEQSFLDVLSRPQSETEERLYNLCLAIENIVTSYDDQLDAFAETIQNAVDAVLQRWEETDSESYVPQIMVHVDCAARAVSVVDNGCAVARSISQKCSAPTSP